jgi:phage head maturation protease
MEPLEELSEAPVYVQGGELELRSESERVIGYRIIRWGELGSTPDGWESFERGAFAGTDPSSVVLRLDHEDPAVARGLSLEEREDAAYMEFRVARTARGDELLGLVRDGIYRGASVGFEPMAGGTRTSRHTDGRRLSVRTRVALHEVGATWRPVFASAGVTSLRSRGDSGMIEQQPATETTPAPIPVPPENVRHVETDALDRLMARIEAMEERSRREGMAPPPTMVARTVDVGQWASMALRNLGGERIPDLELRALAEIITTTNLGVVPDAFRAELLGPIQASRPFLESTRGIPAPPAGTRIVVPRLVTRPTVGVQVAEKDELTSTNTQIDTVDFGMVTVGGAGNLSLQLLLRSSPEFLNLYVSLLGEAYASKADSLALQELIAAGIEDGGTFNPASPSFGAAYANSTTATKRPPNRLWMSAAAYAKFVDAKEPTGGGGRPLYPGLAVIGSVSATGPAGPDGMTLRPVIVPELDALVAADPLTPDMIVGPDMGFAWAEDGTHQLQADNPGQAGRDVALVGMLWFMPLYPGAFTGYQVS